MHLWFFAFLSFIVNIISNYLCMDALFSENIFSEPTYYYSESKQTHWRELYRLEKKSFIVLTAENYKYVLTQPCPPVPADDAYRNQRRLYEKWQSATF